MADFCKQCSIELFNEDYGDLAAAAGTKALKEGYGVPALCESCGPTFVNNEGECIWPFCPKHGTKKE